MVTIEDFKSILSGACSIINFVLTSIRGWLIIGLYYQ